MREIEIGQTERYAYLLRVEDLSYRGEVIGECYGVGVRSTEGEEAFVDRVTVSYDRISALLELLTRNEVTPVTLQDVVEDWL